MKKRIPALLLCAILLLSSACPAAGAEATPTPEPPVIDLDLAALSGTLVYAQVYNMMVDPDPWLGKIIRMAGYYSYYDDQEHGVIYHACVIPDATACCTQGIEFVWYGEHRWPEDYPEIGTDITVTGRLEMYEESGQQYLHLVDADVKIQPEAQP